MITEGLIDRNWRRDSAVFAPAAASNQCSLFLLAAHYLRSTRRSLIGVEFLGVQRQSVGRLQNCFLRDRERLVVQKVRMLNELDNVELLAKHCSVLLPFGWAPAEHLARPTFE